MYKTRCGGYACCTYQTETYAGSLVSSAYERHIIYIALLLLWHAPNVQPRTQTQARALLSHVIYIQYVRTRSVRVHAAPTHAPTGWAHASFAANKLYNVIYNTLYVMRLCACQKWCMYFSPHNQNIYVCMYVWVSLACPALPAWMCIRARTLFELVVGWMGKLACVSACACMLGGWFC